MTFDPEDNLWVSGVNIRGMGAGLTEVLASTDYRQLRNFMPNERPGGFAFDNDGNLFALTGPINTPLLTKQVRELLKSTSYAKEADFTVPSGGVPLDLALDSSGNMWIPSLIIGRPSLEREVVSLSKKDDYSAPEILLAACAVRQLAITRAGKLLASTDQSNTLVELQKIDRALLCPHTIAAQPDIATVSLDREDNLWALITGPDFWFPQNRVLELTKASGFSQQRTYPVPRRVFGIATDGNGDLWTTSPFKNVPYSVGGGRRNADGFIPEDVTRLDAASGYSKQEPTVVPGWPFGIAIDRNGNVWIANRKSDSDNVVEILASDRSIRKTFSVPGKPYGIAIDAHGDPWLTGDFPQYEVVQLMHDAGFKVGRKLRAAGRPSGIAFDPANDLWIGEFGHSESESNLVQFSARSNYDESRRFSVRGSLFALAFDSSANLWAAVAGCPRDRIIHRLKSEDYAKEISFPVDGRPQGVTIDAKGNVWAAVASEPKAELWEFASAAGYSKTRSFRVSGDRTLAVDREGNAWVQSFDYLETGSLTGTGRDTQRYR